MEKTASSIQDWTAGDQITSQRLNSIKEYLQELEQKLDQVITATSSDAGKSVIISNEGNLELKTNQDTISDSVHGSMVSIIDGTDATVKSLTIDIASSGTTEAKIISCGKNLLSFMNGRTSNGVTFTLNNDLSITINGTATANAYNDGTMNVENASKGYPLLPAGTYIMPLPPSSNNWKWYIGAIAPDGTEVIAPKAIAYNSSDSVRSLVLTQQAYIYVRIQVVSGTTVNDEVAYPAVYRVDDEPAEWEQYNGNIYVCDWSSIAGTITSGELDTVNGILTTGGQSYNVAPLKVATKLGVNNIYTNCGNVTLTYQADTKLYINRKIAEAILTQE